MKRAIFLAFCCAAGFWWGAFVFGGYNIGAAAALSLAVLFSVFAAIIAARDIDG